MIREYLHPSEYNSAHALHMRKTSRLIQGYAKVLLLHLRQQCPDFARVAHGAQGVE